MRSILKHPHLSDHQYRQQCPEPFPFATSSTVEVSTHVHFPPTPTLTSIFITHSSTVYDRTPAEVLPNLCALPGRHERELTDTSYPRPRPRWNREVDSHQGSYFQPRGSEPSDSEDSDVVRTPPEPAFHDHSVAICYGSRNTSNAMLPYSPTRQEIESALLFLPHASDMPLKKMGTRRSPTMGQLPPKEPRRKNADGRIQRQSGFGVPTLDFEGCLGGF